MSIEDFIKLHKHVLLEKFLKDKDVNLSLYYNFNELEPWDDSIFKYNPPPAKQPNIITEQELNQFIISKDKIYLEKHYIYTQNELEFILHKLNNLHFISAAKGILWSSSIIEQFLKYWDWGKLSENTSIFWTKKMIIKYSEYIDFKIISGNTNAQIDKGIIERFINNWNWKLLSGNPVFATQLKSDLFEFKDVVWNSDPPHNGYGSYYELLAVNSLYNGANYRRNIDPSISTNQGIEWDLSKYYKYKDKVDLWLILFYGIFDMEFIKNLSKYFDINRFCNTCFTKHSDWRDSYPEYRNGWKNY